MDELLAKHHTGGYTYPSVDELRATTHLDTHPSVDEFLATTDSDTHTTADLILHTSDYNLPGLA